MKVSRARIVIRGAVQGVGFRPFVYRLASELGLVGWVSNSSQGVLIEVEGDQRQLDSFLLRIESDKPPRAFIYSLESSILDAVGFSGLEIRESQAASRPTALVLPDLATCSDCLREIFDPGNRRYLYPFTNCTNCGPRFTIIESLPYDRPNTSMKIFRMCVCCQDEYLNPEDRRFHAQPNACPECGPRLELWDRQGRVLANGHEAVLQVAESLRQGRILALKGLGGFHLLVDARNQEAVLKVRERKHREEKPLALMCPSLSSIRAICEVSELEQRLLLSPECPIVLLRRKRTVDNDSPEEIAPAVAPGNPYLGVMLPYTPLHHILMKELDFPLVATSGNISDEPICIEENEALQRLGNIADVFLVHNRPILRHVDDSVARLILGREQVLRRARGYAPLPVLLEGDVGSSLAVGAHLKNAIAMTVPAASRQRFSEAASGATDGLNEGGFTLPSQVVVSQHVGDLETQEAFEAFLRVIMDLQNLYNTRPEQIVCDLHPDYLSSQYAKESALARGISLIPVQHHYAHAAACMAENQVEAPALGVSWDGTGLGTDGTIWGGEFLLVNETTFERVAHFRQFRLPGGEAAIKEPRRTALGVLYEIFGDDLVVHRELAPVQQFAPDDLAVLQQMLVKGINSPRTSSVGRLFDAVASILRLRHQVSFEGQAAMELEFAMGVERNEKIDVEPKATSPSPWPSPPKRGRGKEKVRVNSLSPSGGEGARRAGQGDARIFSQLQGGDGDYGYVIKEEGTLVVDWEPMVRQILEDLEQRIPIGRIAAKFHNTLVEIIVEIAYQIGKEKIVLTGGCFQNRYLSERAVRRLDAEGFRPYWHQRVPPNDGGIALGQVSAAARSQIGNRPRMIDVALPV